MAIAAVVRLTVVAIIDVSQWMVSLAPVVGAVRQGGGR